MGTCDTSAKVLLIFLAICFWVATGGLIFLAVELLAILDPLDGVINDVGYLSGACWAVIASTFFLFILGIISFVAACWNNKCIQIIFVFILFIGFGGIISSATFCLVYKDQIHVDINDSLHNALFKYTSMLMQDASSNKQNLQTQNVTTQGINSGIDFLQKNYQCCGVDTYEDWMSTPWGFNHWNYVPTTCCKESTQYCVGSILPADLHQINQKGCATPLYGAIMSYIILMIIVTLTTALGQLTGMVCSCIRLCSLLDVNVPFSRMENEQETFSRMENEQETPNSQSNGQNTQKEETPEQGTALCSTA